MAVNKLLPVGTKVRITKDVDGLKAGVIYTVIRTENELNGQSHCINNFSRGSEGYWVWDSCIEVVEEAPQEMKRKKVTFTEIIQMIAEGSVPEGAKFIADDGSDAVISFDPVFCTSVLTWTDAPRNVQISAEVINATWYMETPEVKLSALEAMTELQKGKSVRGVYDGDEYTLSPYTDFDDIWDDSPWADMDELLNKTDFYKVED